LIAIEPSPINFSWLSKNIAENNLREVTLVHGYLSRESGRVNFNHNVEKPGSSFGSDNRSKTSRQLVETEVDSLRLSEVIANLNLVVIKIDVEGGEYDLLDDLIESKNIGNILEIVAEVTTIRPEDYSRLNKCILNFMREGFKPLLRSDSTLLQAKDSKQNHLLLHLINTNWILPDAFQLKKEVY
jgi:FkbM family methyltransferase